MEETEQNATHWVFYPSTALTRGNTDNVIYSPRPQQSAVNTLSINPTCGPPTRKKVSIATFIESQRENADLRLKFISPGFTYTYI